MPHSPQFREAGLSILRHAYKTCEELGVGNADIADLFQILSESVLVGQHEPRRPSSPIGPYRISADTVAKARLMRGQGLTIYQISSRLGIDPHTVERHTALGSAPASVVTQ